MVNRIGSKLRSILLRRRIEAEMQEEMATHLAQAVERMKERGMSEEEARRAALREFGNLSQLQEEARDARGARWLESLFADIRFALRTFRKTPFATGMIVLILAVGLGVNTALFTILHSALTLPAAGIEQDDSLVRIRRYQINPPGDRTEVTTLRMSYRELQDYGARTDLFSAVAGWGVLPRQGRLGAYSFQRSPQEPDTTQVMVEYVTGNFFDVLGVTLALGPGFPSEGVEDPGNPAYLAVIDHGTWDRLFGSDPNVIGSSILLTGIPVTIVGVAHPDFRGVDGGQRSLAGNPASVFWMPLSALPTLNPEEATFFFTGYISRHLSAVARLQPGVDPVDASLPLREIAERAATIGPTSGQGRLDGEPAVDVVRLAANNARVAESPLSVLLDPSIFTTGSPATAFAASLLLLAIVCMNVGALLAAAALSRKREVVVRMALGASRGRIVRQLLTESVLRTLVGAALGAMIVWATLHLLQPFVESGVIALAWEVVLFTFGIALVIGILLGLLPALNSTLVSVAENLKSAAASVAGRRSRLPQSFAIFQIFFTLPVITLLALALAPLLKGGLPQLTSAVDPHIVSVNLLPNQERERILTTLQDRLATLPGVVATVRHRNFRNPPDTLHASIHPGDPAVGIASSRSFPMRLIYSPPGYLEMMNIPLVQGRAFFAEEFGVETNPTPVYITLDGARELWGDENPLGQRLLEDLPESQKEKGVTPDEMVVVGIVDESRMAYTVRGRWESPDESSPIYLYSGSASLATLQTNVFIRTEEPAAPFLPSLRNILEEVAPAGAHFNINTLASLRRADRMALLRPIVAPAGFTALGLFLSAVGLYGVLTVISRQRMHEIGIRMALGASPWRIRGMMLREGLRMGAIGLILGIPFSLMFIVNIKSTSTLPSDVMTYLQAAILTSVLLIGTVLLASWLPARRAASVDPMAILRSE